MNDIAAALLAASPWILGPAITIWRVRRSHDLAEWPPHATRDGPLVSIVIPARNERHNIERSVRSALAGSYPSLEVVVVDDASDDGTGDIARAVAREDARVHVVENTPLPAGWFGKPWACATGAAHARGSVLCFTDADTRHGRDLVARAVSAMHDGSLDMLSVAGHQELGSFWERIVQPHLFWMIASRYGGTESVNASKRADDKIANGQCIFVGREAYEALGGHGAVRDQVAEDMALAQRLFAAGRRTALLAGRRELSTRMYTSLAEIMAGWRKNIFAGGREAMPWGRFGQVIFPALLLVHPVLTLAPLVVLLVALVAGGAPWLPLAAWIALAAQLATWLAVYRWMDAPVRYVPLFPLGAAVVGIVAMQAIRRGSRVEWKGRAYASSTRDSRTSR